MTRDEIIGMAREAGFCVEDDGAINDGIERAADFSETLTRFAFLVAAERQQLAEKMRVRIMATALDCADFGEVESYNAVKVLCSDILEMLNEPR